MVSSSYAKAIANIQIVLRYYLQTSITNYYLAESRVSATIEGESSLHLEAYLSPQPRQQTAEAI